VTVTRSSEIRAGCVAVIGATNAGKSTLVNALVGEKVSIVTHKVQTTRFQVRGIAMIGSVQIVLIDTPGIFAPKSRDRLARSMVHAAWTGADEADAIIHVVDAPAFHRHIQGEGGVRDCLSAEDTDRVMDGLKRRHTQDAILVLNKIDGMNRNKSLALIAHFSASGMYADIFPVSALNSDGVGDLAQKLVEAVPRGPYLYPPEQAADIPSRLMAAEITREKLFLRLHDELPYASTVETEKWTWQKNGSVRMDQVIYVRRESQKPIVLGKGGKTIKSIGAAARADMQDRFGCEVHLFLFVKVREKWADDPVRYRESGLEFDV